MALEKFARAAIALDGQWLRFVTSLSMVTDGGKTPINLLEDGLAGFSPGSGSVTITIGYAIPVGGQEYPFQQKAIRDEDVQAQLRWGGEQYVGLGQLTNDEKNRNVDSPTEGTANWTGVLDEME
jgi:hypothetical protein